MFETYWRQDMNLTALPPFLSEQKWFCKSWLNLWISKWFWRWKNFIPLQWLFLAISHLIEAYPYEIFQHMGALSLKFIELLLTKSNLPTNGCWLWLFRVWWQSISSDVRSNDSSFPRANRLVIHEILQHCLAWCYSLGLIKRNSSD